MQKIEIMKRLISVFSLLMICCPLLLRAQHVAVTGKVTDASGAPVVGATVYQDGKTSNGTATGSRRMSAFWGSSILRIFFAAS